MSWEKQWENIRQLSLEKWNELAALAASGTEAEFRERLLEGCSFCAAAQAEVAALGPPKVQLYACDFCRGNLDYGGCQEPLQAILSALDDGDWAAVQREVAKVQELLVSMRASAAG